MIRTIRIESRGPLATAVFINDEMVNGVEMIMFEALPKDFPRVTMRFHLTGDCK